jgi:hypothetical protein
MYLHNNKESAYDDGIKAGLKGKTLDKFSYALHEVEFDVEVDIRTGEYIILSVHDIT